MTERSALSLGLDGVAILGSFALVNLYPIAAGILLLALVSAITFEAAYRRARGA